MELTPNDVTGYIKQYADAVTTAYRMAHYHNYQDPCETIAFSIGGYDISGIGDCLTKLAATLKVKQACLICDDLEIKSIKGPLYLNAEFLRTCARALRDFTAFLKKQAEIKKCSSYVARANTFLWRAEHIVLAVNFLTKYMELDPGQHEYYIACTIKKKAREYAKEQKLRELTAPYDKEQTYDPENICNLPMHGAISYYLERRGYTKISQLYEAGFETIMKVGGMGVKRMIQLNQALAEEGRPMLVPKIS